MQYHHTKREPEMAELIRGEIEKCNASLPAETQIRRFLLHFIYRTVIHDFFLLITALLFFVLVHSLLIKYFFWVVRL